MKTTLYFHCVDSDLMKSFYFEGTALAPRKGETVNFGSGENRFVREVSYYYGQQTQTVTVEILLSKHSEE